MSAQSHPLKLVLRQAGNLLALTGVFGIPIVFNLTTLPGFAQVQIAQASEAQKLRNQGLEQAKQRQFSAAIQSLKQSLALFQQANDPQNTAAVLEDLYRIYLQTGDKKGLTEYWQKRVELARKKGDRYEETLFLRSLGNAYYCQGDFTNAIASYQKNVGRKISDGAMAADLSELGHTLLKVGKFAEAEATLRNAIAASEAEWKVNRPSLPDDASQDNVDAVDYEIKLEEQHQIYQSLQQALIAQNKIDIALEASEQGRARAFVRLLAKKLPHTSSQLAMKLPDIQQLKQIAKAQKATLVEYSVIYDRFHHECLGKNERSKALRASYQDAKLFIWVIQPTGEVAFRQLNLASQLRQQDAVFEDFVLKMREDLGVGDRGVGIVGSSQRKTPQQQPRLQQLHQILIQPIAELLPKAEQAPVIFIPDDILFYVPFPALVDANGTYLIKKHTLLTSPSIQILDLTHRIRQQKSPGQGALVVGNPSPMPLELAALPGTEREAKAIAQLLNTQPLIGSQATKQKILQQMRQARMIHLATHGLFNETFGEYSALVVVVPEQSRQSSLGALLNQGGFFVEFTFPNSRLLLQDNGLITASDILSLSSHGAFKAELAVLSACDTGLGELSGDGIVGLSRSLIGAGIPSVIVSLWSIPDAPTAALMTEFYRQLQQNPNKATALRNAMLTTLQQTPNPRDWAAFTLIGESE